MTRRQDDLAQMLPGEEVTSWFARALQERLGYARWGNSLTAGKRAMESRRTRGYSPDDHSRGVTRLTRLGSGAVVKREEGLSGWRG